MKPPKFSYACPDSLDHALALLAEAGADAKILAGGQSLVPMLNLRLAAPAALIDLGRIAALSFIAVADDAISIGAMTTHREIENSAALRTAMPIVPRAATEIGHLAIRSRGTIGGSIAHADPAAEWPMLAVLLDAKIVLRSLRGDRTVASRDFFVGPLTTAISSDEILTEIRIARPARPTDYGFAEMCRRHGDFAIAAVACAIQRDAGGRCIDASIAVAGAGPVPLLATAPATSLVGTSGDPDSIAAAANIVAGAVDPASDVHGSADFRRTLARALTIRALGECFADHAGAAHHA